MGGRDGQGPAAVSGTGRHPPPQKEVKHTPLWALPSPNIPEYEILHYWRRVSGVYCDWGRRPRPPPPTFYLCHSLGIKRWIGRSNRWDLLPNGPGPSQTEDTDQIREVLLRMSQKGYITAVGDDQSGWVGEGYQMLELPGPLIRSRFGDPSWSNVWFRKDYPDAGREGFSKIGLPFSLWPKREE